MKAINIKGISKAKLLADLYNNAMTVNHGAAKPGIMTEEEAQQIIDSGRTDFSYVYGRVLKIDITNDEVDPWGYDRDNGEGSVDKIVKKLQVKDVAKRLLNEEIKEGSKSDNFINDFFSAKDKPQKVIKGTEYKVATMFPHGLNTWLSTQKFNAQLVKSDDKPGYEGYEYAGETSVFRLIIGEGENAQRVFDWIHKSDMGKIV